MGQKRSAYRVLVGKSEGEREIGRHRRRREINIKMDIRKIRWDGTD
jgi:hypothetical protein